MTDIDVQPKVYPPEVAAAVAAIMGEDLYVQKTGKNQFHNYKYATVGALLDKIQPLMAKNGLVVLQTEKSKDFVDNGNVLAVTYQFTLAHKSGAVWPDRPELTGMTACKNSKGGFDDKAANKCHTAARKYFLLGLFQVPTGDDYREALHDGDSDGQEDQAPPPPPAAPLPTGKEIEAFEADLKGRLSAVTDLEGLDKLWQSGVSVRVREIGKADNKAGKEAQQRMIAAFSDKKYEIMNPKGSESDQRKSA